MLENKVKDNKIIKDDFDSIKNIQSTIIIGNHSNKSDVDGEYGLIEEEVSVDLKVAQDNLSAWGKEIAEKYIKAVKNNNILKYDISGNKNNTITYLPLEEVEKSWEKINNKVQFITGSQNIMFKKEDKNYNILINMVASYIDNKENKRMYFISKQTNNGNYYNKAAFYRENKNMKKVDLSKCYFLREEIDCIVYDNIVIIFNEKNFENIFNYDKILKEKAIKYKCEVKKWKFVKDIKEFSSDIENTKYVYRCIAKISDDIDYREKIKLISAKKMKKILLEKYTDKFSENDFENNKLKITRSNKREFCKILAKETFYNAIEDKGIC